MPRSRFFFMVVAILVVVAVPLSLLTPQIKRTWRAPKWPVAELRRHSAADASRACTPTRLPRWGPRPAALLVGRILPVLSLLAPCGAGASAPSVRRRNYATDHLVISIATISLPLKKFF